MFLMLLLHDVVAACCILHNICEVHVNEEWLHEANAFNSNVPTAHNEREGGEAEDIRKALMNYVINNPIPV